MKKLLFLPILAIFLASFSLANPINNSLTIQIQVTDSSDNLLPGTYNFAFDISDKPDCSNSLYSKVFTNYATSPVLAKANFYLDNIPLNFSDQYFFRHTRNGVLINCSEMTPESFAHNSIRWNGMNATNSTQFSNSGGTLNILESYLTTFIGTFGYISSILSGNPYIFITGGNTVNLNETVLNNTIITIVNNNLTNYYPKYETDTNLSLRVPYTGATQDVNLGSKNLIATDVTLAKRLLYSNGQNNILIGTDAGNSLGVLALQNILIGDSSGFSLTSGSSNTGVGFNSLSSATTGSINTGVGDNALGGDVITGSYNTGLGSSSLYYLTSGLDNTAGGVESLLLLTTGSNNTAFGVWAGRTISTGSNNVLLGFQAGYRHTGSDTLIIDNQDRGSISNEQNKSLIYGTFNSNPTNQTLRINAQINISGSVIINKNLTVKDTIFSKDINFTNKITGKIANFTNATMGGTLIYWNGSGTWFIDG